MPERPIPEERVELGIQGSQITDDVSPEALRQASYGQLMLKLQTEFRKENSLEGSFILGED